MEFKVNISPTARRVTSTASLYNCFQVKCFIILRKMWWWSLLSFNNRSEQDQSYSFNWLWSRLRRYIKFWSSSSFLIAINQPWIRWYLWCETKNARKNLFLFLIGMSLSNEVNLEIYFLLDQYFNSQDDQSLRNSTFPRPTFVKSSTQLTCETFVPSGYNVLLFDLAC